MGSHSQNMKVFCFAILALSPLLASSLKLVPKTKETYASYAEKNGIPLNKLEATAQYATCYDYFGQGGQSYRVTDYIPDLYSIGWDNRFSSCCYYGIWNMYDDRDYNERNTNAAAYNGWGENYCENLQGSPSFDNLASSARFVGAPTDTNMIQSTCTNRTSRWALS